VTTGAALEKLMLSSIELDESAIRPLVRDLYKVRRKTFWIDFLASSISGWAAFSAAVNLPLRSGQMIVVSAVSMFFLYRSLCFIHEVSHQNRRTLPGFETAYNVLIGFPFLMPSFAYVGVHQSHHKLSTYGTDQDPEYLPFAKSWLMTIVFAIEAFLIPIVLLLRFVLLTPLGLLVPEFNGWLAARASSLTMNVRYRREVTPAFMAKLKRDGAITFLIWASFLTLIGCNCIPVRTFCLWFAVCSVASFINSLRALGAHAYESEGKPLDRLGQLRDSIDTPGAFWTELWAPVGLRYHALHHYLPGIPYHNLPEAYRRLRATDSNVSYREMTSASLAHSLIALVRKGFRRV
jgi:fatty acid desaturase